MASPYTMADVAARAGVHQTTVSLALRNDPRLPEATRQRIAAIALEMGYRPNPLVSALIAERKKGTHSEYGATLAFLTTWERAGLWRSSGNYSAVYRSMEHHASLRGYRLEEFFLHESRLTPARLRSILLARGIRGIVICPLPAGVDTIDFDFSDFASVALGFTLKNPALDHVAIDYFSVMNLAIAELRKRGHRRIAFATDASTSRRVNHLSIGAYLSQRQLTPRQLPLPYCPETFTKTGVSKWLREVEPDAVIVAVKRDFDRFKNWIGRSVPRRFSLVCADSPIDTTDSGVVQNLEEEGRAAIELLTARVERAVFGLPTAPQSIVVNGQWRDGDTVRHRE